MNNPVNMLASSNKKTNNTMPSLSLLMPCVFTIIMAVESLATTTTSRSANPEALNVLGYTDSSTSEEK